jgi:tight adherence protein B
VRSPDLDLVLVVVRACAEHGGEGAEPIDRAAAALRQRAALAGERRTNSAQARMSALVMTCLPLAMLALLALTSRSVRAASTSPAGLVAIALGAMLNLAGWAWMRRLIARATR